MIAGPAAILWIVFAFLAMGALCSVWKVDGIRSVGVAGFVTWAINNAAYYAWAGGYIDFDTRVETIVFSECALASVAFLAHSVGGSRILTIIIIAAMFSVGADLVIAKDAMLHSLPSLEDRHRWNFITNVCFAIERLAIIGIGLTAYARNRDMRHSLRVSRLFVARHVNARIKG